MSLRTLFFTSGIGFDVRGNTVRTVLINKSATGKLAMTCNEAALEDEPLKPLPALASVAAIPTSEALMQCLELPFQSKRTFKDIVTLELERRLPTNIAEWCYAGLPPVISDVTASQLIAAVPKNRLKTALAPLQDKSIVPSIGLHAGALITLLDHCVPKQDGIFLEAGNAEATLIIKTSQRIELVRGLRYGIESFLLLIQEVRRTLAAFTPAIGDTTARTITVLGSTMENPDFITTLSEKTGLQAVTLPLCLPENNVEIPPHFFVAAGAALQACKGNNNFLLNKSGKKAFSLEAKKLRTPALALLAILICWGISLGLEVRRQSQVLDHITQLQTHVFHRALPDAPTHLRPSQFGVVLQERIKRLSTSSQATKQNTLAIADILRLIHLATQNTDVVVRQIITNNASVTVTLQTQVQKQLEIVSNNLKDFPWIQNVTQRNEGQHSTQTIQFSVHHAAKVGM